MPDAETDGGLFVELSWLGHSVRDTWVAPAKSLPEQNPF